MAEQAAQRSIADLPFDNKDGLLVLARIAEAKHDFATALPLAKQVGSDNEDAIALQVTSHLAMGKVSKANAAAAPSQNKTPVYQVQFLSQKTRKCGLITICFCPEW